MVKQIWGRVHSGRWRNLTWAVGGLSLVVILIASEIVHLRTRITIGNLDFFTMAARVEGLSHELSAWVSGFYPVGIPLALRFGRALGLDVVRAGQAASVFGGVLCLCSGALLAWQLTRSRAMALLAMASLAATSAVLFYSGFEGTDMLAAGLQALALSILASNPRDRRVAFAAGLVNGIGYLARYTAMVTWLVCLAYLATMGLCRPDGKRFWILPAVYSAGFLLGSLPQTVPSLLLKGNPFYQTQAYHIWIKLYGDNDFVRSLWRDPPVEITLWQLFWINPRHFLTNWLREFSKFWLRLDVSLVDQPLAQLAKAGLIFAMCDARQLDAERRALLGFFIVGVVVILSIFTVDTRFLILLTPAMAVCALYFLWRVLPSPKIGARRLPLNVLIPTIIVAGMMSTVWRFARTQEGGPHAAVIEASNTLHAAGARSAREILSSNLYHQDVASPTRDRFGMLYTFNAPTTAGELRRQALASGYHFLIYTASEGVAYCPQYQGLLQPERRVQGFTPIWIPEARDLVAYRLEPDTPAPQVATDIRLVNGIALTGYDLLTSAGRATGDYDIGLYLYWQAVAPISQSLKVFVHVFDGEGRLVTQHDSAPALWSYPTDAWKVGETVVDYHPLSFLPRNIPYTLRVGFYDPVTNQRVGILDSAGVVVGDSITLETFAIE